MIEIGIIINLVWARLGISLLRNEDRKIKALGVVSIFFAAINTAALFI